MAFKAVLMIPIGPYYPVPLKCQNLQLTSFDLLLRRSQLSFPTLLLLQRVAAESSFKKETGTGGSAVGTTAGKLSKSVVVF